MNEPDLQQQILDHVFRKNYQPVKPKVLAKQLGVGSDQRRDLKRALKRLVKRKLLQWGENHLVMAGDPRAARVSDDKKSDSLIHGVFRRAAGGYGFVHPLGLADPSDRSQNYFIPVNKTLDAAHGDVVAVKPGGKSDEGRRRGEIVDVVERETHQFVGVYFERSGSGYVQIDGKVFNDPILVGDAGAKSVHSKDKVVVEMVRFPSHGREGEGVITEVLGARNAPGVDTASIMREYDLPEDFPEEVLQDARDQADKFDESIPADRKDLTEMPVITIDPFDARDFDDAISLSKNEAGHWVLGVHIADVVHFVPEGSPLDREAKNRATSVYLPDRVIPMLPEIISNHLASLQPERVRYARSVFIEFTAEGVVTSTDVMSAAIKSDRRFTYEEVDEYLENRDAWREKLSPEVFQLLGDMHELAMMLRKRRFENGSIELHLPEIKIDFDEEGKVSGAHSTVNTESHQMIEEFMLAANEAVARFLRDRTIPFLRRIHKSPQRKKLTDLTQFVRQLDIECESMESRFEIKRVIEEVKGRPEQHAVNFAILRSMQKAIYSPEDIGHYALASDCYCHYTSPIRRYPDLTVHRLLDAIEKGRKPKSDVGPLRLLGEHCSEREQRAAAAERDLVKVKLLTYLSTQLGKEMDAVITGVEDYGLFVQGSKLPAEGLIHVSSLRDDYYQYESASHSLTGRRSGNSFRLGDLLRVEVAHVDIDRRELDFRLVESGAKSNPPVKRPRSNRSRKK